MPPASGNGAVMIVTGGLVTNVLTGIKPQCDRTTTKTRNQISMRHDKLHAHNTLRIGPQY